MNLTVWLLILCGVLLLAAVASSLIFSFSGLWERMDNNSQLGARERIRLSQFGFLVFGRAVVVGGRQSFFGFAFGPNLWIKRRDEGLVYLTRDGLPEAIAKQVQGQVMARYQLHLSSDHNFLTGFFVPYKIEFSVRPPSVTAMHPQTPLARKYRRIELVFENEIATASSPTVD